MTTSSNSSRTSPSTQAPSWRSGAIAASPSSMPNPAFPSHAYAPSDATISTKSSTGHCGTNDGRRSDPLDARRYLSNRPCASSRKRRSFGPPSEIGARKWAKSSLGTTTLFADPSLTGFFDQQPYDRERANAIDPPHAESPLSSKADYHNEREPSARHSLHRIRPKGSTAKLFGDREFALRQVTHGRNCGHRR